MLKKSGIIISVLSLLVFASPFLILCGFNYPGAEDYAETILTHELGVWGHIKDLYLTFDGRYFAAFQYAVNPLVYYQLWLYKLLPAIFFALLLIGIYVFLRVLLRDTKQKASILIASMLLFICCIANMPSISYAFYYMVSSMVYITPVILSLFLFASIFHTLRMEKSAKKAGLVFANALMILAIAGCNEMFMILMLSLTFFILIYRLLIRKNQVFEAGIFFIAAICSAILVTTAPGVNAHFALNPIEVTTPYIIDNFYRTFLNSAIMLRDWIFFGYNLWICTFIFIPIAIHLSKTNAEVRSGWGLSPFLCIPIILLIVVFISFPYFFSLGDTATDFPGRVYNDVYILFVFGWFFSIQLLVSWVSKRIQLPSFELNPEIYRIGVGLIILISIPLSSIWKVAMKDITSGEAYGYHLEMKKRLQKFNSTDSTVVIQPLNHQPETIFSGIDIGPNRDAGWNTAYEIYFDLEQVTLEGDILKK